MIPFLLQLVEQVIFQITWIPVMMEQLLQQEEAHQSSHHREDY